jgi:hypothetical protein
MIPSSFRWLFLVVVCLVLCSRSTLTAAPIMGMGTAMMPRPLMGGMFFPQMMNPAMMATNPGLLMNSRFMPMTANPYAMSGNAGMGYSSGMGYGMGYGGGMGSSNPSSRQNGQASSAPGNTLSADSSTGVGLRPRKIDWPLGVRLLPDVEPICQEVELLTEVAANQSARGKVNPDLVKKAVRDIDELRNQMVERGTRGVVPESTIDTAKKFLDNLKETLKAL